ncbi:MAG TPA: alkaline phosphatase PhoX, partial [Acetobacteraceae bacterium]|nr:alkaline phosphatase PhoX [Acetobacteraceae bacterium]
MTDTPDQPFDPDDIGSNPDPRDPIGAVIARRLSRRGLFGAGAAAAALLAGGAEAQPAHSSGNTPNGGPSTLTFPELRHQLAPGDAVAEGYEIQLLIRWGDPIGEEAPEFDVQAQTAERQQRQFGYNCDYLDFFPLPAGSRSADHGLLVVNHEYTNANLMFPGLPPVLAQARRALSPEQVAIEQAAHGLSVVEVRREGGRWTYARQSRLNRRITAATPMRISGPAAGHERMRTNADPTGTRVLGTFNNCAGGNTPWGTVLTAEENFNFYFGGAPAADPQNPQHAAWRRYNIGQNAAYGWNRHDPRFDLAREPNELNRFGWIVEFDPYDPESVPVKRTALGRFKHEGATHAINRDGRVVFY